MKKVLTIILCALLMGCSNPNEAYEEATAKIEDEGYSVYLDDSGLLVYKTDVDGSKSNFIVATDTDKLLYRFDGSNFYATIYDTDEGLLGSIYDDYMTYCSYSLTDNVAFDGSCDQEWVAVIETAKTLRDTYLSRLDLTEQEFVEWANWYIDNH